ncbi:MAG: hypothetical protein DMD43_09455 [Gemmatimonadetes bacterium]|nr:MAG: hypothetical protein DMD43_09455 [Gemmatimonadota bacterium]
MDQELFNLELRKFLKRFGITAQREMENAVAAAIQKKALSGHEVLQVRATLTIPGVLPELVIDGEIALDGLPPPAA